FEVFIDPDGDSHEYYELEINALGTEWDLLLVRPYRDGAPAVNAWDIQGLKTGISVSGTLNDPGDRDSSWSVEIAIPWKVLAECAHRPSPPHDGDTWWVNFSRVQWHLDTVDGGYVKRMDSSGEKSLPENNWVWSPQGLIAMHYPEMWGLVQFSTSKIGTIERSFEPPTDLSARWALRQVYYAEREFEAQNGRFTDSKEELALSVQPPEGYSWPPRLNATDRTFTATITSTDNSRLLSIGTDGRLTSVEHKTEEN
ncbi:MAG: carbohydrate-binding family 9-like protein, partial [bacterium]|nr:carbohydrate-binding family 9-like protein [bacterium]